MRISLADALKKLPLPATPKWPDGVWDLEAFAHGTMSVVLFAPQGKDYRVSHGQDELYIVVGGEGELVVEGVRHRFAKGDVLFVPARKEHHFENFSRDLVTWAVFWGPQGGESESR